MCDVAERLIKKGSAEGEAKGRAEGEAKGRAEGRKEGEKKLGALVSAMLSKDDVAGAKRVSEDSEYREKMYKQYGISL